MAAAKPAAERAAALRLRLEALRAAHDHPDELLAPKTDAARPTSKTEIADEPADEAVGQALGRYKLGIDTKQVVARFEAERPARALMDHPNIAKVPDQRTHWSRGSPPFSKTRQLCASVVKSRRQTKLAG